MGSSRLCLEYVLEIAAGRNWTLSHVRYTIHLIGAALELTMKVNTSRFVLHGIVDIDRDCVPKVGVYDWGWPLSVYSNDWAGEAVRGSNTPGYVPVMGYDFREA